jgi:energy-coupling factor transporter ATP-binding protein EcfA2
VTKGRFVLIVGPDGCGKSTLARALIEQTRDRFPAALHMHWRPGLLPRPGRLIGMESGDPSTPHARTARGVTLSLALLAYHWLDSLIGSWVVIVPARARGRLIVMERGWVDIAVDPYRYRLSVPPWLVELLGRLLPSPDVAVILHESPGVLAARKAELPERELARQMARWREIAFPRRTIVMPLSVSESVDRLVERTVETFSES